MKRISCDHNTNYKNYPFCNASNLPNVLDNHPFKVKITLLNEKEFRVDGIPSWVLGCDNWSPCFVHSHKDNRFTGMFVLKERNIAEGWGIVRNMKDELWEGPFDAVIDEEAILDNAPNWHPIRGNWICNWYYYNEDNDKGGMWLYKNIGNDQRAYVLKNNVVCSRQNNGNDIRIIF